MLAIPPPRAVEVLVAATLVADAAVALLINPGAAAPRVALLLAGRHRRAGVAASAFLTVVAARTALAGPGGRRARRGGRAGARADAGGARALVASGPPC